MFNIFKRSKILVFKDLNFEEEEFSKKLGALCILKI